ncbi:4Fe-4S domain-containing protein [Streptomyces sp. NPDC002143]
MTGPTSTMKVVVDETTCLGTGQCAMIAPAVFEQRADGVTVALATGPHQGRHAAAREAALACPVAAIRLIEESEPSTPAPTAFGYDDLPGLIARMTGDERHAFSSSSTKDVLWVLYHRVLNVSPDRTDDDDRDRFFNSKGAGPMAQYAVLAAKGFLRPEQLDDWGTWDSPLGYVPDRVTVPGVDLSSGSLGHGVPIAVGVALAWRIQGRRGPRVFVLIGDGEFDEGSNHEAMVLAGRMRLDQVVVVVVDNGTASHGWPGGIERRFAGEGWATDVVDGENHDEIFTALTREHTGKPLVVVATVTR